MVQLPTAAFADTRLALPRKGRALPETMSPRLACAGDLACIGGPAERPSPGRLAIDAWPVSAGRPTLTGRGAPALFFVGAMARLEGA